MHACYCCRDKRATALPLQQQQLFVADCQLELRAMQHVVRTSKPHDITTKNFFRAKSEQHTHDE
jgi:hypothetical protein